MTVTIGRGAESIELGDVIAERAFERPVGPPVVLRIGRPRPHPEGDWICPFLFTGVNDGVVYEPGGVDAVQALELALQMIGILLPDVQKQYELTWHGDRDLGL